MPRAISHIFREVESREAEYKYTVKVSYMEIYNERMFDLLRDARSNIDEHLVIVEDKKGGNGVHVKGLKTVPVRSLQIPMSIRPPPSLSLSLRNPFIFVSIVKIENA